MFGSSLTASGGESLIYHDAGIASTFTKEPFHTLFRGADVDGGTGRRLNRGHLNALCGGDPSLRSHPERIEYFAPPAAASSSTLSSSFAASASTGGRARGTPSGAIPLQIESFSRSSAGKEIAEPGRTRSPAALSKSMHFLVEHYIRQPHTPLAFTDTNTVWGYLWDRFRGIRTTWIPQLPAPTSPEALERLCASPQTAYVDAATGQAVPAGVLVEETRQLAQWLEFTIASLSVAAAYMCRTPAGCAQFAVHNKKNFIESMSQCFTFLAVWYRAEVRLRHAEFISLLLILYGFQQGDKAEDRAAFCRFYSATDTATGEEMWYAESAAESVNMARVYAELEKQPALMNTPTVRRVLRLLQCWAQRNWFEFFRLCREEEAFLTPLQRSFLFQSFTYARYRAVMDLVLPDFSVYAKLRVRGAMQVSVLADMLLMEGEHCLVFLRTMGLGNSLMKKTKSDIAATGGVQSIDPVLPDSDNVEEIGEWWLQLCDKDTNPVVLSAHLKEQCEKHKTDLFFPTYPEYFGFRVWHEAYTLYGPASGLAGAGGGVDAKEASNGDGYSSHGEDDYENEENEDYESEENQENDDGDEEEEYQDEYYSEDLPAPPKARKPTHSSASRRDQREDTTASSGHVPTLSDAVLLRMEGCPINLAEVLEPYCPPYTASMATLALADAPETFFDVITPHRRERLWTHVRRSTFERHTLASLPLNARSGDGAVSVQRRDNPDAYALLEAHKGELLEQLDKALPVSSGDPHWRQKEGTDALGDEMDDDAVSDVSDLTEREEEEAEFGPYVALLHRQLGLSTTGVNRDAKEEEEEAGHAEEDDDDEAAGDSVQPAIDATNALLDSITHSHHYLFYALTRDEVSGRKVVHHDESTSRGALQNTFRASCPSPSASATVVNPSVLALPETGRTSVVPLPDDYVSYSPSTVTAVGVVESPKTPAVATFASDASHGVPRLAAKEEVEDVVPLAATDPPQSAAAASTKLPPITFRTTMPSSASTPVATGTAAGTQARPPLTFKRTRAEAQATDTDLTASGRVSPLPDSAGMPVKLVGVEQFAGATVASHTPTSPTSPPSAVESSSNASLSAADGEEEGVRVGFSHVKPSLLPQHTRPDWRESDTVARQLRVRGAYEETSSWQRLTRGKGSRAADSPVSSASSPFLENVIAPLAHQFLAEVATLLWVGAGRVGRVQDALASTLLNADMSERDVHEWYCKLYAEESENEQPSNNSAGRGGGQRASPSSRSLRHQLRVREGLARRLCCGFSPALVPEFEWIAAEAARLDAIVFSSAPCASATMPAGLAAQAQPASSTSFAALSESLAALRVPLPSTAANKLDALTRSTGMVVPPADLHNDRYASFAQMIKTRRCALWPDPTTGAATIWGLPQPLEARRREQICPMDARHLQLTAVFVFVSRASNTVVNLMDEEEKERRRERGMGWGGGCLHADPASEAKEAACEVLRRLYTNPLEQCVAALLSRFPAPPHDAQAAAGRTANAAPTAALCAHNSRTVTWCTPVQDEVEHMRDQYADILIAQQTLRGLRDEQTGNINISLRFGPVMGQLADDLQQTDFGLSEDPRSIRTTAALRSPLVAQLAVVDRRHRLHRGHTGEALLDATTCLRVYGCGLEVADKIMIQRNGNVHFLSDDGDGNVSACEEGEKGEGEVSLEEAQSGEVQEALATGAPALSLIICLDASDVDPQKQHNESDATHSSLTALERAAQRAGRQARSTQPPASRRQALAGVLVLLTCTPDLVETCVEAVQTRFWRAFHDGHGSVVGDAPEPDCIVSSSPASSSSLPVPFLCVQPLQSLPNSSRVPLPWVQDALYQGTRSLLSAYAGRVEGTVRELNTVPAAAAASSSQRTRRGVEQKTFLRPSPFTSRAFATLV